MMEATDIVLAAKEGDINKVEKILTLYPTQVDIRRGGHTALHAAARAGHIDVMKRLISHNPDLDYCDSNDCTPLHYAVKADQPEAVLLLLKTGAKPDEEDVDGKTPYDIACERNYEECIKAFMERGNKIEPQVTALSSEDEETERTENVENTSDLKKKLCKYCKKHPRIMKFEPCECVISCFECSVQRDDCKCGKFVEKRFLEKNDDSLEYIRQIKFLRTENMHLNTKVEKLEGQHTCKICMFRVVNCTLDCGHLFCIPCVRKTRGRITRDHKQLWECSICKESSRYTKLFPEWRPERDNKNSGTWDRQ